MTSLGSVAKVLYTLYSASFLCSGTKDARTGIGLQSDKHRMYGADSRCITSRPRQAKPAAAQKTKYPLIQAYSKPTCLSIHASSTDWLSILQTRTIISSPHLISSHRQREPQSLILYSSSLSTSSSYTQINNKKHPKKTPPSPSPLSPSRPMPSTRPIPLATTFPKKVKPKKPAPSGVFLPSSFFFPLCLKNLVRPGWGVGGLFPHLHRVLDTTTLTMKTRCRSD